MPAAKGSARTPLGPIENSWLLIWHIQMISMNICILMGLTYANTFCFQLEPNNPNKTRKSSQLSILAWGAKHLYWQKKSNSTI